MVGGDADGWHSYSDAALSPEEFTPDGVTLAGDPLLLYFTSGTTSQPKLVGHTQASYPVGHLSTMYWIGIKPGDVHLNISSPGWAKHAWSNLFAPWNAQATILILNQSRFSAPGLLAALGDCGVTTFCAPPTVWRMLIQADLSAASIAGLRECVAAGEPLNPEVIEQVRKAWGITVRDGFGQTETTAQIGNPPGQPLKLGSMGRPLPGYPVVLVDPVTGEPGRDGEICLDLADRPLGLMTGYQGDPGLEGDGDARRLLPHRRRSHLRRRRLHHLRRPHRRRVQGLRLPDLPVRARVGPDQARGDRRGRRRPVTRPAPPRRSQGLRPARRRRLPLGRTGPATSCLLPGASRPATSGSAGSNSPSLPKTISGKIRRVELRAQESDPRDARGTTEFWEEDFTW